MPREDEYPRRRAADSGIARYLLPMVLGLVSTMAVGAFTFAWSTSRDVALLKAQTAVSPVDFTRLQERLNYLDEKTKEHDANAAREIERIRTWLRNHTHGGAVQRAGSPPSEIESLGMVVPR